MGSDGYYFVTNTGDEYVTKVYLNFTLAWVSYMNGDACYAVALSGDETKLYTGEDDTLFAFNESNGAFIS